MEDSTSPQSQQRPSTTPLTDESALVPSAIGSNADVDPSSSSKRKRDLSEKPLEGNRRAGVWLHYDFYTTMSNDGKTETKYAKCKYCTKGRYKATAGYGTTNASTHLEKCERYKKFVNENPEYGKKFDQKVFLRMFAEAIMFHSYPLRIVEHEKLRDMLSYLEPRIHHVTRNTILSECVKGHEGMKSSLRSTLASLSSRVCFTADCWSVIKKRGYLTLTAHYIDSDWVLRSCILNFRYFPPPHRGHDIYEFVLSLLKEWGLEGKAFSMTVNTSSNDVAMNLLTSDLDSFSPLPCSGKYFHVRCCAHILNLIVQCGMETVDASVVKLREAVLYINGSDIRKCKFERCVKELNLNFVGKLRYDVCTRWNSTYFMMKRCLEARKALDLFAKRESDYIYGLNSSEWEVVEFVCKFLEPFNEITNLFSGSDYPTANLYLLNVVAIEKWLVVAHTHSGSAVNIPRIISFETMRSMMTSVIATFDGLMPCD